MKNILLVDDIDAVRKALRRELERRGFNICGEAADGIQAVAQARELRPDLILLDRSMPKLDGIGVASALKKEMPEVAIILFTLYPEPMDSFAIGEQGFDMVLAKTDGIEHLVQRINELSESRSKRAND
jgi:DNA-binding NarL/FixJ family response regulator